MVKALGDECRYFKVNLLLAPGINIKRSPLGGRGYEYYIIVVLSNGDAVTMDPICSFWLMPE